MATIQSQIKQQFFDILEKSTIHGIPKIFLSKHGITKLFWLTVTLFSCSYCGYLVTSNIVDFYKFEVVTKYENIHESQPIFPFVYFCEHDRSSTVCAFDGEPCPDLAKSESQNCETFNG
jgi:hypothetical protein